jgi:hypothetical protein
MSEPKATLYSQKWREAREEPWNHWNSALWAGETANLSKRK